MRRPFEERISGAKLTACVRLHRFADVKMVMRMSASGVSSGPTYIGRSPFFLLNFFFFLKKQSK
jgi:hypothetical protein